MSDRILVIKLSALGDFVLAFGAFARIRAAHPQARITLLTTPPYEELGAASPWFDEVREDGRAHGPASWLRLAGRLRRARFDWVYDLQNNDRTRMLRRLAGARSWSGEDRRLRHLHPLERHAAQLRAAGIWPDAPTAPGAASPPDLAWLIAKGMIPPGLGAGPLALLVAGASPGRPKKRWPAERFGGLAAALAGCGFSVAVLGGAGEPAASIICERAPGAVDLTGRTSLADLAALGAKASLAVGADTGPMHILAAAGAPSLVLFSSDSDPALSAPRGRVEAVRRGDLAELEVRPVLTAALSLARLIGPRGAVI